MKKLFLECFLLVFTLASAFGDERSIGSIPYGKYNIGDEGPGGGIVFYVSKEGFKVYDGKRGEVLCHYLEMTAKTLGLSKWLPGYVEIGGTGKGLGYGKANTYKILEMSAKLDLNEDNCAAYRVSQYSTPTTKKGDWWLPSKEELSLMYKAVKGQLLATLGEDSKWHWSSSEAGKALTWLQYFEDGLQYDGHKDYIESVRGVRSF